MGKAKESEKHRKIRAIVMDELRDCGVFYKTSHDLYYLDQLDSRLFPLTDVEFRARINDRFDINGIEASWRFVLENLHKEALLYGLETTIHRFARYEGGNDASQPDGAFDRPAARGYDRCHLLRPLGERNLQGREHVIVSG